MARRSREADPNSELRNRSIELRTSFGVKYGARLRQIPEPQRAQFAEEFEAEMHAVWHGQVDTEHFGRGGKESAAFAYRRLLVACSVGAAREPSVPTEPVTQPSAEMRHDVQSTLVAPKQLPRGVAVPEQEDVLDHGTKEGILLNMKDLAGKLAVITQAGGNEENAMHVLAECAGRLRKMVYEAPVGKQQDARRLAMMGYCMRTWVPLAADYGRNGQFNFEKQLAFDGYIPALWRLV
jgi:hypothetical protein